MTYHPFWSFFLLTVSSEFLHLRSLAGLIRGNSDFTPFSIFKSSIWGKVNKFGFDAHTVKSLSTSDLLWLFCRTIVTVFARQPFVQPKWCSLTSVAQAEWLVESPERFRALGAFAQKDLVPTNANSPAKRGSRSINEAKTRKLFLIIC